MLSRGARPYLLEIYCQSREGCAVRSVEVARSLGVSRASVSKMAKILTAEGSIAKERYGNICLTQQGIVEANRLFTQCTLMTEFFRRVVGLAEGLAQQEARGALSFLSEDSLERCAQIVLSQTALEQANG